MRALGANDSVSGLIRLAARLLARVRGEMDRAVVFGTIRGVWGLLASPTSALLIALYFTKEIQGFYYTFFSLLGLQVFAEMGLGQVIVQFASHEWAHLEVKDGRLTGDPEALSRLVSLGRFAVGWYASGATVIGVGLMIGGRLFFASNNSVVHWQAPWLATCIVSSVGFLFIPLWALLEGCNQVGDVYRFRFWESVIGSVALWLSIVGGLALWAPAAVMAAKILYNAIILSGRHRGFFSPLLKPISGPRIGWRSELLALQWRFAVSWMSGYLVFSAFTPIAFRYLGAAVAGQVGMTLRLTGTLLGFSNVWVLTKTPRLGVLVARRDYRGLDRLTLQILVLSMGSMGCMALVGWLGVCGLNAFHSRFAERLLPPLPTAMFLLAELLIQATVPLSAYLRAHKREPLMWLSVAAAILVTGSNLLLGKWFGAAGMAAGYLGINALVAVPGVLLIWRACRRHWHLPQTGALATILSATEVAE